MRYAIGILEEANMYTLGQVNAHKWTLASEGVRVAVFTTDPVPALSYLFVDLPLSIIGQVHEFLKSPNAIIVHFSE